MWRKTRETACTCCPLSLSQRINSVTPVRKIPSNSLLQVKAKFRSSVEDVEFDLSRHRIYNDAVFKLKRCSKFVLQTCDRVCGRYAGIKTARKNCLPCSKSGRQNCSILARVYEAENNCKLIPFISFHFLLQKGRSASCSLLNQPNLFFHCKYKFLAWISFVREIKTKLEWLCESSLG